MSSPQDKSKVMARSCYPQDKEDKMETRGPRRQEKADLCSPLCGCEAEK